MKLKTVILVLVALLVMVTSVLAVAYLLDRTVPATVTITTPPGPMTANIYSDPAGLVPFVGGISFGTVAAGDTITIISAFYIRGTEINPATVTVTSNLPNNQGTLDASVGAMNNYGNYPVTLTLATKPQADLGQLQIAIRVRGQS